MDTFVTAYLTSSIKIREREGKGSLPDMDFDELHDLVLDCVDAKLKSMQDARKQLTANTVRQATHSIEKPTMHSSHHDLKGKIIKIDGKIVSIDGRRV